MDSNWLKDFLAVLDEGSFSRAAERRAITQPAFSRRIRALEEWVGASLFDRTTHTIRLTPAGKRFKPVAFDLNQRIMAAREDALSAAIHASRCLRFASTHALSLTFFPLWLRSIEESGFLDATVQLTADSMIRCEQLMLDGKVHFLICHHHPAADWKLSTGAFRSVILGADVIIPVAAPAAVAKGMSDTRKHLAYAPESGLGRILASAGVASVLELCPEPAFSSHLASALVTMAREGRGIAWSPRSLVEADLADGRLVRTGKTSDEVKVEIRLFRPIARLPVTAESFWQRLSCRK